MLTVIGKFGAFAKDIFLSFQFGAGQATDAYFIATTIPGFVFSGAFVTIGLVFLPLYQKACLDKPDSAALIVQTGKITYGSLALMISSATIVFASRIVHIISPSSIEAVHDLAITLTRIFAIGFVFSGWVGLQNALSQAHKSFIWPQVIPVTNHLVVILGLYFAYIVDGSIIFLAIFAVIGWIVSAFIMTVAVKHPFPNAKTWRFSRPVFNRLIFLSIPVFISLSLDQTNTLIDVYLGSRFGTGAVSHLNYATRIMLLFSGAFGIVISYFIFPYLTESIHKQDNVAAQKFISRGIVTVLALTMPLSIISYFRAPELIAAAFQRGAFSPEDVLATAAALQLFAVGIIFIGLRDVLNRVFLARQATVPVLAFGLIGAFTNVITSVYFSNSLGLSGIALGTSCGAIAYVIAQIGALTLFRVKFLPRNLIVISVIIGISAFAMSLVLYWTSDLALLGSDTFNLILELTIGTVLYLVVLVLGLFLFRHHLKGIL